MRTTAAVATAATAAVIAAAAAALAILRRRARRSRTPMSGTGTPATGRTQSASRSRSSSSCIGHLVSGLAELALQPVPGRGEPGPDRAHGDPAVARDVIYRKVGQVVKGNHLALG